MNCIGLIGLALITLSACASRQPTQSACVVAQESGFVGAGGAQTQITVARNGSPCVIDASIRSASMGQGQITAPPSHGTATVQTTAEATSILFTPARDYVGEDRFAVALGPNFRLTVLVQVVPIATGPTAPR
jgi:plastocyanin domain-containing protein